MKRILVFLLFILVIALVLGNSSGKDMLRRAGDLISASTNDRSFAVNGIKAESAVLMDEQSGKMWFYKNDKTRLFPASTTKIVTALVAFEHGDPDDIVTVGDETVATDPEESRAGIVPGQRYRLFDLIEALMLPSGNDAARTIAVYIARKDSGNSDMNTDDAIAYFAGMMNKRAKAAGATDTNFVNPNGLHDDRHYSTARDLAYIARDAMANDLFREVVKTERYTAAIAGDGNKKGRASLTFTNTNQLLQKNSPYYFEGTTGIKTGFTNEAGYCLISSATRNGTKLISVVMHSSNEDVWSDSRKMLDYGFGKE